MARIDDLKKAGLSEKQAAEHIKLYEGYLKKIEEIMKRLSEAEKEGNATYSEIRELKLEEGFCINAIKLHEMYFDNIASEKCIPREIAKIIKNDFGSYEAWEREFIACALSTRGWVVLAYDWRDEKLHNYIADMHNQGGVWDTIPLLVLDMYEHAYFIDYGADKKSYIKWFTGHIDWKAVDKRAERI